MVSPGEGYIGFGEVGVVLEDRCDGLVVSDLTDVAYRQPRPARRLLDRSAGTVD
jgi:hypothetical protein